MGTEAGWNRTEPTPRWRSLLDRARAAGRASVDEEDLTGAYSPPMGGPPTSAPPLNGPPMNGPPSGQPASGRSAAGPPASAPPHPASGPPVGPQRRPRAAGGYANGKIAEGRASVPVPGSAGFGGRVEWQAQPANTGVDQLIHTLRQELRGPKVLAFANPKGGVHKTTATVLAAATIGGVRGRGVLAWDDNELRGTLGLRAGSARHARTIRHLIHDLASVEATNGPELLDRLDQYLRHASDGSYDVLAGEESPRFAQKLDPHTVRRVLDLLRRTHEVICVDTGNNVESANWQTVLQSTDQLVITTVPREDAAFTADWMIDLLHDTGLGNLATNAVTLLSCPTPNPSPLLNDLARHFATRTRAVVVVPYDPLLESGSSIEHTQLAPATRRAWLQATAVMMNSFGR